MTICEELRQAVLQAAIQGKLTEQRAEDGTAEELLEEIKKEKERLVATGKIKKEKPLPEISEDEIPFDIPENWRWVRLSTICNISDGTHQTPKYVEKGMPFISAQNVKPYRFIPEVHRDVSYKDYCEYNKMIAPAKGDILMTRVGAGIGEAAIIDQEFEFSIYVSLTLIKRYGSKLYMPYLLHVLNSPLGRDLAAKKTLGKSASQGNLNLIFIREFVLPIPPLAEQLRIVTAANTLMAKIDALQIIEAELEAMKTAFPGDMRDAILQAAMQGKLTEQLPEDGMAEELLKEIKKEKDRLIKERKIRKEKPLPEVCEDDVPFDIPESWRWVRLGDAIFLLSGSDLPSDQYNENEKGMVYITGASNIKNDDVIVNRWTMYPKNIARKGDILLTCKGTIGTTCILSIDEAHIARQIMAIRCIRVDTSFVRLFLSYYVNRLKQQAKSMIPGIERKIVIESLFPLPPLAEQHRIVARLNELLPLCDALEEAR